MQIKNYSFISAYHDNFVLHFQYSCSIISTITSWKRASGSHPPIMSTGIRFNLKNRYILCELRYKISQFFIWFKSWIVITSSIKECQNFTLAYYASK